MCGAYIILIRDNFAFQLTHLPLFIADGSGFVSEMLYALLIFGMRATCDIHLFFSIMLIMFEEEYTF